MNDDPPQNPAHRPTPPRAYGRVEQPHPYAHSAPARPIPPKRPSNALGVLSIVFGILAGFAGVVIVILPYLLFVLGGGGNAEGFDDFARAFGYTGGAVVFAGLLLFVFGIVRTITRKGARRKWDEEYRRTY
ncbi:DUF4064 domain-containing protein [Nocardiopsis aegyptia]|nr:DUF4064 domain-containing protein [Nocardiopsis aegyptia]